LGQHDQTKENYCLLRNSFTLDSRDIPQVLSVFALSWNLGLSVQHIRVYVTESGQFCFLVNNLPRYIESLNLVLPIVAKEFKVTNCSHILNNDFAKLQRESYIELNPTPSFPNDYQDLFNKLDADTTSFGFKQN